MKRHPLDDTFARADDGVLHFHGFHDDQWLSFRHLVTSVCHHFYDAPWHQGSKASFIACVIGFEMVRIEQFQLCTPRVGQHRYFVAYLNHAYAAANAIEPHLQRAIIARRPGEIGKPAIVCKLQPVGGGVNVAGDFIVAVGGLEFDQP